MVLARPSAGLTKEGPHNNKERVFYFPIQRSKLKQIQTQTQVPQKV